MRLNRSNLVTLIVKLAVSSVLLAFGICLYVEAGLGSDSIDVLLDGMSRTLGVTLGQADQLFVAVTLGLALVLNRKAVGIPSVLSAIVVSLLIDVVNRFVMPLDLASQGFAVRFVALAIGQVALGGAYGILQTIAHGMNVVDAIVKRTSEVAPGSYVIWRMVYDVAFLVAGMTLGGVFGIGTVFYVAVNGVSIKAAARFTHAIEARVNCGRSPAKPSPEY